MADKQGNGQGLPRYFFDLGTFSAGMANTFGEAVVSQGNVPAGTADTGNPMKVGGVANIALPTAVTSGQRQNLWLSPRGSVMIGALASAAVATGAANTLAYLQDQNGADRALAVVPFVFNGTTVDELAKASGTSRIPSSTATTNATVAKASAGTVYFIDALNTSVALKYLKLYNKATSPTVGTDTPILTIAIPPTNGSRTIDLSTGMYFSAGISYALTGAAADADATAVAAGDVVGVNITFS